MIAHIESWVRSDMCVAFVCATDVLCIEVQSKQLQCIFCSEAYICEMLLSLYISQTNSKLPTKTLASRRLCIPKISEKDGQVARAKFCDKSV